MRDARAFNQRPSGIPAPAYCPRRPDLADVACGFPMGPGAAARVGACGLLSCTVRLAGCLREKSGMCGRPFFFMRTSVREVERFPDTAPRYRRRQRRSLSAFRPV